MKFCSIYSNTIVARFYNYFSSIYSYILIASDFNVI